MTSNKNITPYQDINELLLSLSDGIKNILAKNLNGIYLFGSLSYGDFNPDSSDIDLVINEIKQTKLYQQMYSED